MNKIFRRNIKRTEFEGFTIIEALVAIAIFTLLSGAVAGFIVMLYRTQGYAVAQSAAIDEARKGVEAMAREIRQACFADNGAYPIEKGAGKEIVFFSDTDGNGSAERVRYFLAATNSGAANYQCVSTISGGSCSAAATGFLTGELKSAQVRVSIEGDLGSGSEYAEFFVDGIKIDNICQSGCTDCAGAWQGTQTYDVTSAALDGAVQFLVDSTSAVGTSCNWQTWHHSIKAFFEFSWVEEIPNADNQLKKGIIRASGSPPEYYADQEEITVVSFYVRNAPPIFTYYDENGGQITESSAILQDTKMMKLDMIVDVNPLRSPASYELEQWVQIRNLKE